MVYCFELCDRAMHCGETALAEVATHLKVAKKQKREWGGKHLQLQGHTPNDLISFPKPQLLKVSLFSSSTG